MAIDLYLNASAERIANHLQSLQPDGDLASWEVKSYQVCPRTWGTARRLSILAGLRRPGEVDVLTAYVLLQELDTDRCMLSISANPTLTTPTLTADGEKAIEEARGEGLNAEQQRVKLLTMTARGQEVIKETVAHGWEPEIALFAWLLSKARRAWPEIDDQLAELDKKLGAGAVIGGAEEPAAVIGGGEGAAGSTKRGAPRLTEREPAEYQVAAMKLYREAREKGKKPMAAAQLAGVPDYRTVEDWLKAWSKWAE